MELQFKGFRPSPLTSGDWGARFAIPAAAAAVALPTKAVGVEVHDNVAGTSALPTRRPLKVLVHAAIACVIQMQNGATVGTWDNTKGIRIPANAERIIEIKPGNDGTGTPETHMLVVSDDATATGYGWLSVLEWDLGGRG